MSVGCAVAVEPCAVIGEKDKGAGVRASILALVCAIGYPFRMFGVSLFALGLGCKAVWSNTTLNLAPFGRWTLRDKAAQRRLAPR